MHNLLGVPRSMLGKHQDGWEEVQVVRSLWRPVTTDTTATNLRPSTSFFDGVRRSVIWSFTAAALVLPLGLAACQSAPATSPTAVTRPSPEAPASTAAPVPSSTPLATALATATTATTPTPAASARIEKLSGEVSVRRPGQSVATAATSGMVIEAGTTIKTAANGRILLVLSDNSSVGVNHETTLTIAGLERHPNGLASRFDLESGRLLAVLRGESLEVRTPAGSASVSGSILGVDHSNGRTDVTCLDGYCVAQNNAGKVSLSAGTRTVLSPGAAPSRIETLMSGIGSQLVIGDENSDDWGMEGVPGPTRTAITLTSIAQHTAWPLTMTARAQPTSTPTPTKVSTPLPTFGPTSTPAPSSVGADPTVRPTAVGAGAVGPDGLTAAERANAGYHVYGYQCQAYNKCACSPSKSDLTITFSPSAVQLAADGGSISYAKVAPSIYTYTAPNSASTGITATITFYPDGWVFDARKAGAACSVQTYRLP